jgi:hypothetical protein
MHPSLYKQPGKMGTDLGNREERQPREQRVVYPSESQQRLFLVAFDSRW